MFERATEILSLFQMVTVAIFPFYLFVYLTWLLEDCNVRLSGIIWITVDTCWKHNHMVDREN